MNYFKIKIRLSSKAGLMQRISTVIITYNEEKAIERCLKTVAGFSDEIVVVDSFSTDRTIEIVKTFTDKIFQRKPESIINQINYATSLATNEWVFCIDADERVTDALCERIKDLKKNGFNADAYSVNRLNYYINDFFKYCGWYPDRKIRLFNKTLGTWGGQEPHYAVIMKNGTNVEFLQRDLIHFTYRDIFHQVEKMNRFSTQAANSKRAGALLVVRIFIDPTFRFIKTYFFQLGFLGGIKGFANAAIGSFYVFCKYLKMWENIHRKDMYAIDKEMFDKPKQNV
jgi:glycosyltransferase involved in cell wall biosynthesis